MVLVEEKTLRREFDRDGYVIFRNFFSEDEVKGLMASIQASQVAGGSNDLDKGSLRFHMNLFKRSKALQTFIAQPKVVALLSDLIGPNFWVRWDQAVAKDPGAGTFPWHQDNRYSRLRHPHYQLWIAITEMTAENGGLWLQPSSDRHLLPHKKDGSHVVYSGEPESPILIEAQPGDVVIFSSYTLHCTTPNVTQKTRWAYVIEFLALNHFDPTLEPPYFVVARDGKPQPAFADFYLDRLHPLSLLKYLRYSYIPGKIKPLLKKPRGIESKAKLKAQNS